MPVGHETSWWLLEKVGFLHPPSSPEDLKHQDLSSNGQQLYPVFIRGAALQFSMPACSSMCQETCRIHLPSFFLLSPFLLPPFLPLSPTKGHGFSSAVDLPLLCFASAEHLAEQKQEKKENPQTRILFFLHVCIRKQP